MLKCCCFILLDLIVVLLKCAIQYESSIREFEHFKLIRFERGEATAIKVFLSFVKML